MANIERGAYEPRVDNVRTFDMADDDDQVEIEEGSRLPLLIVIALLVLAAFAGVVWLAYSQGVQRGRADAPRIIAAEPGPVKVAPANPGGTQTPYTGLKIYQQPAPPDSEADNAAEATPAQASDAKGGPSAPPDLRPSANGPQDAAPANNMNQQTSAAPTPKSAAPTATPPQSAASHAPNRLAKVVPPPDTSAETPAPTATPKPAQGGGAYVLQIGAYKSQSEANAAWDVYKTKHPMVRGYESDVKQVDLGAKGLWYRLRIASFADKGAAVSFCEKLKAGGGTCFLAK